VDDEACREASKQEIIRRFYASQLDAIKGVIPKESVSKIEILMQRLHINLTDREVVGPALEKAKVTDSPSCALQLADGRIITGRTSKLLGACSSVLLNALKVLADIDDNIDLLSPAIIEPIQKLKVEHMGSINPRLHTDEILITLAVSAVSDPIASKALGKLKDLKDAQLHSSVILSAVDEMTLKKLGVNLTCEPKRRKF
jgi:uncharacterized protein (UPF0371 family)